MRGQFILGLGSRLVSFQTTEMSKTRWSDSQMKITRRCLFTVIIPPNEVRVDYHLIELSGLDSNLFLFAGPVVFGLAASDAGNAIYN